MNIGYESHIAAFSAFPPRSQTAREGLWNLSVFLEKGCLWRRQIHEKGASQGSPADNELARDWGGGTPFRATTSLTFDRA